MNFKTTYEKITKYRSVLMGIAILWIVWYHSGVEITLPGFGYLKQCGYAGVDIFLFLSGIGIYRSLSKNQDLLFFYEKRLSRIMYTYLPIFTMWFFCRVIYDYNYNFENFPGMFESVKAFLGNIFMLGWNNSLRYQFNWYIQTIMWFYFVSPVLFFILKKCSGNTKRYLALFISLIAVQIVFMNFFQTLMAVSRIFIYVLGMLFSQWYEGEKDFTLIPFLPVSVVGFVFSYLSLHIWKKHLWTFGLWWYPNLFIVPGLLIVLACIVSFIDKVNIGKRINHLLKILGAASLEICLIQTAAFEFLTDIFVIDRRLRWILISLFTIIAGLIYRAILNVYNKQRKQKQS